MSGSLSQGGWALVGLGRIARSHLDGARQLRDGLFTAAVEPIAANAEGAGIERVVASVGALLEGGAPPAAVVCTPPSTHRAVVTALLDAGVHVLVEKPLAAKASDAWALVERARERGLVLQTGAKFLQMAAVAKARELVAAGAIGRLVRVENTFAGVLDPSKDWHGDPEISGGGVLVDNGPHSINVVTALAGPVEAVRVLEMEKRQGTLVEDAIVFELRCGDVTGRVTLSWNEPIKAPIARIVGTEGAIVLDWRGQHIERGAPGSTTVTPLEVDGAPGYDKVGCFAGVLRSFAEAIDSDGDAEARADADGARVMEVVAAAYRAAAHGGWEDVR